MPTYDYECTKCGHHFEAFHKISEQSKIECPKCKAKAQKKIGAGSGIIFKGSGFYATDYKKDKCSSCPQAKGKSCDKK